MTDGEPEPSLGSAPGSLPGAQSLDETTNRSWGARIMGRSGRYRTIAEVGSALAVALTLLFIGLQLRETSRQTALNTTSIQVAAYQDLNAQISHFNELLLDPEIAAVFEMMVDPAGDWSKFSPVQRRQARSLLYMRVRHADMAFYQFDRGMLSAERLDSALRPLLSDIATPVFRAFWDEVKSRQVPAFREYLDRRIAEAAA